MIVKIVTNYFKQSYKQSKVAFYCELCEAVLVGGASATLTFTVLDPATKVIIPMYFIGSIMGVISTNYTKGSTCNDTNKLVYNNECNCLSKIISMKNKQMIKVK